MEKEMKIPTVKVVIKSNEEGSITFQLKDPSNINSKINEEIKKELSNHTIGAVVVQPDRNIIDSQKVCLDTSYLL